MIEYKKAITSDDLLVDARSDRIMIGHKDSQHNAGVLCIPLDEFDSLSEKQIIQRFNQHIDLLLDDILNNRPIEIVHGEPQIQWNDTCRQWASVGDVLRCELGWDEEDERVSVLIDGRELSGDEFMKVLEVYEGWGMRVEFVHPNRLLNPPEPLLRKNRTD